MNDRISRPSASIPRNRGAPSKPQRSKCASRACRYSEPGGSGRRTVSPTRTMDLTFSPIDPLQSHMRLYDYAASCNCYKVRLLLAHLGLEYERVPVDIFAGDTLTDEYG